MDERSGLMVGVVSLAVNLIALIVIAYVYAKPAINRWATIRTLAAGENMRIHDLLTPEQRLRSLSARQRLRFAWRSWVFVNIQRCMTRADRVRKMALSEAVKALMRHTGCGWHTLGEVPATRALTERERLIVHETVGQVRWLRTGNDARATLRSHRGVRCSGGCGTKFGKRRNDHNFSGGPDIDRWLHGWRCPDRGACRGDNTADVGHLCGMCSHERTEPVADCLTSPMGEVLA